MGIGMERIVNVIHPEVVLDDFIDDLEEMERICINPDCGWIGSKQETVHPKHWPGDMLCPECHEVTEEYLKDE